jgi:hypothetical protein
LYNWKAKTILCRCALPLKSTDLGFGNPVAGRATIKPGKEVAMTRIIFACLPLLLISVVAADSEVLDFSALKLGEEVLGYYDGGFGSLGSGPGPNFGITFTDDFVTVAGGAFGPSFHSEELTGGSGTMDVAAGFSGPFSFYYENSGPAGAVDLYSGLDGSGSLVGTLLLPPEASFFPAGLIQPIPFESAVFSGSPDTLIFNNITFGELVIPEPATVSLLFPVLVALWLAGRNSVVGRATRPSR